MRKISTVFRRDPANMARVLDEWHPACLWVRDGEGTPTRKYDGTCVMLDGTGRWWARREVKPGKTPPPSWRFVEEDRATGKRVGWEPIEQSSFAKVFATVDTSGTFPGTYELVGPKVNGNPERYAEHTLVRHSTADPLDTHVRDFDSIRDYVVALRAKGVEGIVWHHPDGRMAKIKGRDFPAVDGGQET